jgi:hypothetical protein
MIAVWHGRYHVYLYPALRGGPQGLHERLGAEGSSAQIWRVIERQNQNSHDIVSRGLRAKSAASIARNCDAKTANTNRLARLRGDEMELLSMKEA